MFIDYVDHEFCLRCNLWGYKIIEASNAILRHSVGRLHKGRFMGREISFSDHSPLRKYYFVRNILFVYFNYYRQFTEWVTRDCKVQLKNNLVEYCCGAERFNKVLYSLLGLYHFCINRYGKLS